MTQNYYIQVILPLKLDWQPWYVSPSELKKGDRIKVIFSKKEYPAVVWKDATRNAPDGISQFSSIIEVEKGLPGIDEKEISLWEFIASYYLCTLGEVFKAAYSTQRIAFERSAARKAERRASSKAAAKEAAKAAKKALEEGTRIIKARKETVFEPPLVEAASPVLIQGDERLPHYIKAIREALGTGGKALVMVPSHSALDVMQSILKRHFPDVISSDSRQSLAHRRKADEEARSNNSCVIIGERNSIFLPLRNLALVIIDEEQDQAYKFSDHAPRCNARDCALILSREHRCRAILGASCPSLETMHNCILGKFERIPTGEKPLCPIEVVDINAEFKKKGMVGFFSRILIRAVSGFEGKIVFVRGWEKMEELETQIKEFFHGRNIIIVRSQEALETDLKDCMVAILQADALVDRDDFRSDECALRLVRSFAVKCRSLIVQTCTPSRFDASRRPEDLLLERKRFGFPPYTRLVETIDVKTGEIKERFFLQRDSSLQEKKAQIARNAGRGYHIDVDPLYQKKIVSFSLTNEQISAQASVKK